MVNSIHPKFKSTHDCLATLVGFNTVSSQSNRQLIDWAANRLEALGASVLVQHGENAPNAGPSEAGKANLFATIGPADQPGLILSGHSDVVPVAGQDWHSDPFQLIEKNNAWVARGSADMKGFIACAIESAEMFSKSALKQPIHIALSYNEESNMRGMRQLAAHLAQTAVKPMGCVIGEPTSMKVVVANKGAAIFRCRVQGFSVHSSLRDQGISAVELAAEVIVFINALQKRLNEAERHDGFDFPHSSVHVGMIQGGTAHNITAKDCEFSFEIRALPGVSAQNIVAQIRSYCSLQLEPSAKAVSPECRITIEEILDAPGLDERGNRYLAKALAPLCQHQSFGRVSFGTEAGMLQEVGIPTIVCGPGEIRVAHQPDEYVEISQINECLYFMDALSARLSASRLL
jgi:acetylornithine deacetylase